MPMRPAPHSARAACTATTAVALFEKTAAGDLRRAPEDEPPADDPRAPRRRWVPRSGRGRAPRWSSELRGERVSLREQPGQPPGVQEEHAGAPRYVPSVARLASGRASPCRCTPGRARRPLARATRHDGVSLLGRRHGVRGPLGRVVDDQRRRLAERRVPGRAPRPRCARWPPRSTRRRRTPRWRARSGDPVTRRRRARRPRPFRPSRTRARRRRTAPRRPVRPSAHLLAHLAHAGST